MVSFQYLDCELFLTGRHQARLSVAGRDYLGCPTLDRDLEMRLLEADLLPERYGALLFGATFPPGDDLLAGYRESLALARHGGQRMRVRLHISSAAPPALHQLRWELLNDADKSIAFGRSQEMAFSRYLGGSFEPGRAVTGRPRLLVVLSCPRDLAAYGLPELDRGAMGTALELSLATLDPRVEVEFFDGPATVQRLRDRLVTGEVHALHLQGHGLLPADRDTACLVLEDEGRNAAIVEEPLFAEVFEGQRSLRLVTLVACNSGAPSPNDPFSGLGQALVRRGIPAVVAMRRQIGLETAHRLSEHLYRNLARTGQVDTAVNEARLQLYLADPGSSEWSLPSLYMHLWEGRLWTVEASEAATTEGDSQQTVLRTLLASRCEQPPAAATGQRHDHMVRSLLAAHGGREIEKGEGFLVLFDRPAQAVRHALAYHQTLAEWSSEGDETWSAAVGVHLGEICWLENRPGDISRGAPTSAAHGPARDLVLCLLRLAGQGQTLLTRGAFDLARQSATGGSGAADRLLWLAHGEFLFRGLEELVDVFEVGAEGRSPLRPPRGSEEAMPAVAQETIPGWRPAPGLALPRRANWTMEKKLGAGGFGEVWLAAHQKTKERRVFKFCWEASRLRALQREITLFRLLKEELGNRHDIARILDWSFEETPFFIESEYADDGDLLEWAERRGGLGALPLEQRLEIVAQAATALAAAHSVGVLHKDIKPANLLIGRDPEGNPQVLLSDFGIGTVTDRERLADAGITALGLTAKTGEDTRSTSGTRLYMAPELLEGKRATLQADIYALGVILYQVVVGDFSRALAPGWRRDIDDELLREDIALVVDGSSERRLGNAVRLAERLRALPDRRRERQQQELERQRAHQTREALARAHRRRKLALWVAVVGLLFAGAMAFQARRVASAAARATAEAERANRETATARQVTQFMVDLFAVSNPSVARGEDVTARELLDQGAQKIRALDGQPLVQARLMNTIGTVYRQLGLYALAEPLLTEALDLRRGELGDLSPDVAQSMGHLALIHRLLGRYDEAESLYQQAMQIVEQVAGADHPDLLPALNGLGLVYWRQGRYAEAEARYRQALEIAERAGPGELADPTDLVKTLNNLGLAQGIQGRFQEAEQLYLRALAILEEMEDPDVALVATALSNLGNTARSLERYEDAEEYFQRALMIRRKILEPDHPGIAGSLNNLAGMYVLQNRDVEAEALFDEALAIWEKTYGPEHRAVGGALSNLGDIYRTQGRSEEAEVSFRRALEILEATLGSDHVYLASPLHGLAALAHGRRQVGEAETLYRRALAIREGTLVSGHPDLLALRQDLARLLRSTGREAEAGALEAQGQAETPPGS